MGTDETQISIRRLRRFAQIKFHKKPSKSADKIFSHLCFICENLWLAKKQAARSAGNFRQCGRRRSES
jgi:hypothetical protein